MTSAPSPDSLPPRPPGLQVGVQARAEAERISTADRVRGTGLDVSRTRLVWASIGFSSLFGLVALKLALATVITPVMPHRLEKQVHVAPQSPDHGPSSLADAQSGPHVRATIMDRNGEILAISLPTAALFANPREIMDPAEAVQKLKKVLPELDTEVALARLSSGKQFVYLARHITPREQLAINDQGIPGVYFEPTERRRYPQGRVAAQVLGGVDVDGHGVAGVEKYFDKRLRDDTTPLRLSVDVRVQGVLRDELSKSMETFSALGACGIVMDVRTGEVIAMVSLPDYDANQFGTATAEERFNRAVTGMYEPGSTFKLQTASMALDSGLVHLWDQFDAAHNITVGRFTITDYKGKHRSLYLPEVLAYSSNLGAAHIAQTVGAERQRAWLRNMGMFARVGIELPEQGRPLIPPAAGWKELTTMTVGFGHGIAVSPLHVVRGTAAIANGGVRLRPTILDHGGLVEDKGDPTLVEADAPEDVPPPMAEGETVMKTATSDVMRRLMRLVVTGGYGKAADIPGYFVGGKTGTAEKIGAHGYKKHANVSAFMSVFPMNAPRYAVYFMLDEPHGTKETGGYSTAGAVSAPGAGRVIARIAPMLGLFPETANMAAIQAGLDIPLQPGHGYAPHAASTPSSSVATATQPHAVRPAVSGTATSGTATRPAASRAVEPEVEPEPEAPRPVPSTPLAPLRQGGVLHETRRTDGRDQMVALQ